MKTCEVEGCDRPYYAKGLCDMHRKRLERHGNINTVLRPDKLPTLSYSGLHQRLVKIRGRAKDKICVDCGCPANEWSYNHTAEDELWGRVRHFSIPYSLNIFDYEPRCYYHHRVFDKARSVAV